MALLVSITAVAGAQDGVAVPEGSQTFTLTLLHDKEKPTWTDIEIARGTPFLRVLVNGKSVCGLIDTGADRTLVDIEFARAQGLTVVASDRVAKATSGTISTSRVPDVAVEVPGQFSFRAELIGIDIPAYECPGGGELTFVLGLEVIRNLAIGIDAPRKKVIFLRAGSITPRGDNWARFEWIDGIVMGKVNSFDARMRVDTGSGSLLLVPANRFDTLFPGQAMESLEASTNAAGRIEENLGISDVPVSLGGLTVRSQAKRIAAVTGPEDANLGYPFFMWTFTIFDAGQNMIAMRLPEVPK